MDVKRFDVHKDKECITLYSCYEKIEENNKDEIIDYPILIIEVKYLYDDKNIDECVNKFYEEYRRTWRKTKDEFIRRERVD